MKKIKKEDDEDDEAEFDTHEYRSHLDQIIDKALDVQERLSKGKFKSESELIKKIA